MSPTTRIEAKVVEPHCQRTHHEALPADAVAGDAVRLLECLAHPLDRLRRDALEYLRRAPPRFQARARQPLPPPDAEHLTASTQR
jgi:hypothetical protein